MLDIFDTEMNKIGTMSRKDVHLLGCWHQTFHCWVATKDKNGEYLLFQRRSPNKRTFPNLFDISAAGHLIAGESVRDGVREVHEELGLNINFVDLNPLFVHILSDASQEVVNNEFCHVYLYIAPYSSMKFNVQLEEVSGLYHVKIDEMYELINNKVDLVKAEGTDFKENGFRVKSALFLSKGDFVPNGDEYYTKVLEKAKQFLRLLE
ncbi:MAG TPA: NUDIX domain-containing protein [Bacillota bacterium]|nr:NUDIX domain-containing protein [Bacillota bacterium]